MNKKLIIVLGTGRCGTKSLTSVLNYQPGFYVTHELRRIPWKFNKDEIDKSLNLIMEREAQYVGDAAFWYLRYVPYINDLYTEDVYFICLKRDKKETIKSYLTKTPLTNHWTDPRSGFFKEEEWNPHWSPSYPQYDLLKKDALDKYYDQYYEHALRCESEMSNFKIVDMNSVLNTEGGQSNLIHFLGIPFADIRLLLNCKLNSKRNN